LDAKPAQAEERGGGREDAEKDDDPGLEVGGRGESEQAIPTEKEEGAEHETPEGQGGAVSSAEKLGDEARKAEGDEVEGESVEGEGAAGPGAEGVADEAEGEARAALVEEARAGVEAEGVEGGGVGGDAGGGGLGAHGIDAMEVVEGVGDLFAEADRVEAGGDAAGVAREEPLDVVEEVFPGGVVEIDEVAAEAAVELGRERAHGGVFVASVVGEPGGDVHGFAEADPDGGAEFFLSLVVEGDGDDAEVFRPGGHGLESEAGGAGFDLGEARGVVGFSLGEDAHDGAVLGKREGGGGEGVEVAFDGLGVVGAAVGGDHSGGA
jgi:hypothetical protein